MTRCDVEEVIDALGGNTRVGKYLDISPQAISNWKRKGIIPKSTWRLLYRNFKVLR